jgi:hypothetical protein
MTIRVSFLQLAVLVAVTAPVAAQARSSIPIGARVRVWPAGRFRASRPIPDQLARHRFVGTFVRSSGDTLIVLPAKGGPEVALSSPWLARLDVSRGRHARTGRGALIGLFTGVTSGAIVGYGLCGGCGDGDTLFDPTPGEAAALWVLRADWLVWGLVRWSAR